MWEAQAAPAEGAEVAPRWDAGMGGQSILKP